RGALAINFYPLVLFGTSGRWDTPWLLFPSGRLACLIILWPLVKRRRSHLALHALAANLHLDRVADLRVLERNVSQCNVLFEIRSVRSASHKANLTALRIEHAISIARNSALHTLQAYQHALYALCPLLEQRGSTDEVALF